MTDNPIQTNSGKKKKVREEKDLLTKSRSASGIPESVDWGAEGIPSKLSVHFSSPCPSPWRGTENGGYSILKMSFLPVAVPGRSRLITVFTSSNLLPNRTQHNLRTKPQWPGLTHMPIPGPVTVPWTMVHTEWSQWVLCPPRVSMDSEGRQMVSEENWGAITWRRRKDAGQVKITQSTLICK